METVTLTAKAYFFVDALRALAPLGGKKSEALIGVLTTAKTVRLEACTAGLGGVINLAAESEEPGQFVIPAVYVDQIAKVFPPNEYASGGALHIAVDEKTISVHDDLGRQIELPAMKWKRANETAYQTLTDLIEEFGTDGTAATAVLDPDRARVVLSVSKLLFGDIIIRQPDSSGPAFVSIGQSFSGYLREPGWYDSSSTEEDDEGLGAKVTVIRGQLSVLDEIEDD